MRLSSLLFLLVLLLVGCGSTPPDVSEPNDEKDPKVQAVKMRHQIMVRYGEESQVFEGYMILRGGAFVVKAFAGPGIDLFTVVRNGERHREELHMSALDGRLDPTNVGDDIARAYLGGCEREGVATAASCDFFGEPLEEEYDEVGRLVERRFPEAHGIGMKIRYSEHALLLGRERPQRIELVWGSSGNRMVIVLTGIEPALGNLDDILEP